MAADWETAYDAVNFLARKWVIVVLAQLAQGSKRHNELARITGADHRSMDRALTQLLDAGLVERNVDVARKPLQVHYRLTPHGHALRKPLAELAQRWQGPAGR